MAGEPNFEIKILGSESDSPEGEIAFEDIPDSTLFEDQVARGLVAHYNEVLGGVVELGPDEIEFEDDPAIELAISLEEIIEEIDTQSNQPVQMIDLGDGYDDLTALATDLIVISDQEVEDAPPLIEEGDKLIIDLSTEPESGELEIDLTTEDESSTVEITEDGDVIEIDPTPPPEEEIEVEPVIDVERIDEDDVDLVKIVDSGAIVFTDEDTLVDDISIPGTATASLPEIRALEDRFGIQRGTIPSDKAQEFKEMLYALLLELGEPKEFSLALERAKRSKTLNEKPNKTAAMITNPEQVPKQIGATCVPESTAVVVTAALAQGADINIVKAPPDRVRFDELVEEDVLANISDYQQFLIANVTQPEGDNYRHIHSATDLINNHFDGMRALQSFDWDLAVTSLINEDGALLLALDEDHMVSVVGIRHSLSPDRIDFLVANTLPGWLPNFTTQRLAWVPAQDVFDRVPPRPESDEIKHLNAVLVQWGTNIHDQISI